MFKKIKCFFNYHEWEITDWIMPYKKECTACKKRGRYFGYGLWIDE